MISKFMIFDLKKDDFILKDGKLGDQLWKRGSKTVFRCLVLSRGLGLSDKGNHKMINWKRKGKD